MRRAAYDLDSYAESLRRRTALITADLFDGGVWWQGSDAEQFRSEWRSQHEQMGERVSRELRSMANRLRSEAAQQEAISQC